MAWIDGSKCKKDIKSFNSYIKELTGDLNDLEAKITLIKFLKENLGFTFELISGTRLMPFQEIILKGLFLKDNGMFVAGRGVGKSYLISIFACLYPIFNPNAKICLISSSFRNARRIFENMDKIIRGKDADLLSNCYPKEPKRLNDIIQVDLPNGSSIFALPLNPDKLRGTRSSVLILDEMLLLTKHTQETILRPFLTAKQNYLEEITIKEQEEKLIKAGVITEKDRISFPKNKFIGMSSSSYAFEYLYELYLSNINSATEPIKTKEDPTYFVCRMSYEAVPEDAFMDLTSIESAKANGGEFSDYFQREYQARFIEGSEGYFSVKKMHECTVEDGSYPTVQIQGDKTAEYILTIDPSYSAAKSSDFFAMGVYMLVPQERKIVLVHSYGKAGGDLKDHFAYLTYILTHFNIVWISIDASGTEFTDGYNESTIAKDRNIKLNYITADLESDEYLKEIQKLKREHNLTSKRIVYAQKFTSGIIRNMNEHLQNGISTKKVWFASRISSNEDEFKKAERISLPFKPKDKNDQEIGIVDFIEQQDDFINETKSQLALIEAKSTALGTLQYDLPSHLKKSQSTNKARRDNYTCILMGYYASRFYYDMVFTEEQKVDNTFTPFTIG